MKLSVSATLNFIAAAGARGCTSLMVNGLLAAWCSLLQQADLLIQSHAHLLDLLSAALDAVHTLLLDAVSHGLQSCALLLQGRGGLRVSGFFELLGQSLQGLTLRYHLLALHFVLGLHFQLLQLFLH